MLKKLLEYTIKNTHIQVYQLLLSIWLIGILINLIHVSITYLHFRKFLHGTMLVVPEEIAHYNNLIKKLSPDCCTKVNYRFAKSRFISGPAITGLFHPIILLPDIQFSETELEFIFSHEIAHIKHHDIWWHSSCNLLCIIYWWNPLTRLFKNQVEKALEFESAKAVTKTLNPHEKIKYLECLLKVQRHQFHNTHASRFVLSFSNIHSSATLSRAKYLITPPSKKSSGFIMLLGILLTFLSTSFIFEPYSTTPDVEAESFAIEEQDGYFIKNSDNTYSLYLDDNFVGTVLTPDDEDFKNYPIYNNKEEIPDD